MRVYLAGPTSGPLWNRAGFAAAAAVLTAQGHDVYSVHSGDIAAGFDPANPTRGLDLETALDADAAAVIAADVVVTLAGGDPSVEMLAAGFGVPVVAYEELAAVAA